MKADFSKLMNDFRASDERISLVEELQQKAIRNPNSELADDQVIVSTCHTTAVIDDVFFAIYKKLPQKIITASERSKIVSMI